MIAVSRLIMGIGVTTSDNNLALGDVSSMWLGDGEGRRQLPSQRCQGPTRIRGKLRL